MINKKKGKKKKEVVEEVVEEEVEEEVEEKQPTRVDTPPPSEPPPPSVTPGSNDDDPGNLFQQLAEASSMTNDIVRRLEAYGLGEQARDVVSSTVGRDKTTINSMSSLGITAGLAVRQSQEALEAALQALNMTGNLDARARELKSKAERLAESANQTAKEVELQVEALNKKIEDMESKLGFDRFGDEDEYEWDRKPLGFGLRTDLLDMYNEIDKEWSRLAPGVKRKDGNPVGSSPYSPLAYARSSAVAKPIKIPLYAFANPEAFRIWAEDNGFGGDTPISVEVKGLKYGQSGVSVIR